MAGSGADVKTIDADVVRVGGDDVSELRRIAADSPRKRALICAHRDVDDPLHEMLIARERGTYVRPHRHPRKTESMHVIEGLADIVILDEQGEIAEVVPMGDYPSGRAFYYRLNARSFHTIVVRSEMIVLHEITNGPFDPADTVYAPWAPEAADEEATRQYLADLDRRLAAIEGESLS